MLNVLHLTHCPIYRANFSQTDSLFKKEEEYQKSNLIINKKFGPRKRNDFTREIFIILLVYNSIFYRLE